MVLFIAITVPTLRGDFCWFSHVGCFIQLRNGFYITGLDYRFELTARALITGLPFRVVSGVNHFKCKISVEPVMNDLSS